MALVLLASLGTGAAINPRPVHAAPPDAIQMPESPATVAAPAPVDGPVNPEARRLFAQGKEQLADGAYDDAIRSFEESYARYPAPGLIYILAQAHRLKGDCATALKLYRQYLPIASREMNLRDKTEARIADMERCTAEVKQQPPSAPSVSLVAPAPQPASSSELAIRSVPVSVPPSSDAGRRPRNRMVSVGLAGASLAMLSLGGYFTWQSVEASHDVSSVYQLRAPWTPEAAERERIGLRDEKLAGAAFVGGTALTALCLWYLLH